MDEHAPGASAAARKQPPTGFDTSRRFVRVTDRRRDGFVEFDFAVGEPEVFVELVMTAADFEAFCAEQGACRLAPSDDAPPPLPEDWQWRLADAQRKRFR